MITLLASLAGFLSSAVPELFKLFNDRADKKQELAIMQMQMQVAQQQGEQKLDEITAQGNSSERVAMYQTYYSGVKWVDALNATVRPVITYAFFMLYALMKYVQFLAIGDHAPIFEYLDVMWADEDQAIFASVISFYFGQRAMNKMRGK